MEPNPALKKLLARLPTEGLEYATLLEAIHTTRFTGPIVFDFLHGVPKQISFGQPIRLVICAGEEVSVEEPLDRNQKPQAP